MSRHNSILVLRAMGRPVEALDLFERLQPVYMSTGDRVQRLRGQWLLAKIAASFGRGSSDETAERAFRATARAAIELQLPYESGKVLFELGSFFTVVSVGDGDGRGPQSPGSPRDQSRFRPRSNSTDGRPRQSTIADPLEPRRGPADPAPFRGGCLIGPFYSWASFSASRISRSLISSTRSSIRRRPGGVPNESTSSRTASSS
jgi:hypothetical protein